MFGYISVVSRGDVLLISIWSILKTGKLHIIAACAIYLPFYLLQVSKNMVAFCSTVQKFH